MHHLRTSLPSRLPNSSGSSTRTRVPPQIGQAVAPGDGGNDTLPDSQRSRHGLHALPSRTAQIETIFHLQPPPPARAEQLVHGPDEVIVAAKSRLAAVCGGFVVGGLVRMVEGSITTVVVATTIAGGVGQPKSSRLVRSWPGTRGRRRRCRDQKCVHHSPALSHGVGTPRAHRCRPKRASSAVTAVAQLRYVRVVISSPQQPTIP